MPQPLPNPQTSDQWYLDFLKEISFFESESFIPDRAENRLHRIHYWFDFPSPPPFHIKATRQFTEDLAMFYDKYYPIPGRNFEWTKKLLLRFTDLIELSAMAGFVDLKGKVLLRQITQHDARLSDWRPRYSVVSMVAKFPRIVLTFAFLMASWGAVNIALATSSVVSLSFLEGVLIFLSSFLMYIIMILIVSRLASFFWNRKYAENLCAREIIFILMELKNLDDPGGIDIKTNLRYRLHRLAQLTRLLALRFRSRDQQNQGLIEEHFRKMAYYIYEWERKLVAPTASTIGEMRRDFATLARIYISQKYGEFTVQYPDFVPPEKPAQRATSVVVRFVGLVIPLVLMGIYILKPDVFPGLGLPVAAVVYTFAAWFFLMIDNVFGLGVVKDLVAVAKGVKDLGA